VLGGAPGARTARSTCPFQAGLSKRILRSGEAKEAAWTHEGSGRCLVVMCFDGPAQVIGPSEGGKLTLTPWLARYGVPVDGTISGRSVWTKADETTDDEESSGPLRPTGPSDAKPFLVRTSEESLGEIRGRTVVTRAAPETTDEGDDSERNR
jgi:hypothetical protein